MQQKQETLLHFIPLVSDWNDTYDVGVITFGADYDLAKHNKSQDDISEQKYESMVARNIEVIKSSHKEKGWRYLSAFLGITFVYNILKGNIAGAFGFGDDDEDAKVEESREDPAEIDIDDDSTSKEDAGGDTVCFSPGAIAKKPRVDK